MPNRTPRPCSRPGCGKPAVAGGKCEQHRQQQRKHTDSVRGTASDRGYGTVHEKRFRAVVLSRDGYTCQLCGQPGADTADHHPHSRRELVAMGENPDDPQWGRALHTTCHNRHTGKTQGWMATQRAPDPPPPF